METRSTWPGLFDKALLAPTPEPTYASTRQRPRSEDNTVDVRQLSSSINVALEIQKAVDKLVGKRISTLYVIHGRGAGVRKTQVEKVLQDMGEVESYSIDGSSHGGTTVAKLRLPGVSASKLGG